jgi:hypothetical protein
MQVTCLRCETEWTWPENLARSTLCPKCGGYSYKAPPPLRFECVRCHHTFETSSEVFEVMHCRTRVAIPLPPLRGTAAASNPVVEAIKNTKEALRTRRTRTAKEGKSPQTASPSRSGSAGEE